MAKVKLKWKVGEVPTGPYRSFQNRSWPNAEYRNGDLCAAVYCEDSYTPARARGEQYHAPLTLMIADHSLHPWRWRKVKRTFTTLDQAKSFVSVFIKRNHSFIPQEIQDEEIHRKT